MDGWKDGWELEGKAGLKIAYSSNQKVDSKRTAAFLKAGFWVQTCEAVEHHHSTQKYYSSERKEEKRREKKTKEEKKNKKKQKKSNEKTKLKWANV